MIVIFCFEIDPWLHFDKVESVDGTYCFDFKRAFAEDGSSRVFVTTNALKDSWIGIANWFRQGCKIGNCELDMVGFLHRVQALFKISLKPLGTQWIWLGRLQVRKMSLNTPGSKQGVWFRFFVTRGFLRTFLCLAFQLASQSRRWHLGTRP